MLSTTPVRTLLVAGLLAAAPRAGTAATALSIDGLYCLSQGNGRGYCEATVSGGTGGYTYSWKPQSLWGPANTALVRCTPYTMQTVTVTVTDSSGATATAETSFYCGAGV